MQNMYSYEYDLKPLDYCGTSSFIKDSLKRYEANECERLIQESFHASFKDDDVLPSSLDTLFDMSMFEKIQNSSVPGKVPCNNSISKQLFPSNLNEQFFSQHNCSGIFGGKEYNSKGISGISNNISGIIPTICGQNLMGSHDFAKLWHPLLNSTMLDKGNNISSLKMKSSTTRDPFTSMLSKPMSQLNLHDNGQNSNLKSQSTTKCLKQTFYCSFCFNNERVRCERQKVEFNANNPKGLWNKHNNKNDKGIVTCPFLRKLVCPSCGATGDFAHTRRHCPLSNSIYK